MRERGRCRAERWSAFGGGCLAEAGNVARDLAAVQDLGGWERFGLKILPWFLRKGTQVPPSKKKYIYIGLQRGLLTSFLSKTWLQGRMGACTVAGSNSAPGSEPAAGDGETRARLTCLAAGQHQRHLGGNWGVLGL